MESLISIIVPVYNVAPYLRRCVESLLNQIYKNIEIILVDDGSTDGSGLICDEYAQNHKNIHVIHKTNGGLGSARNAGMEVAIGEFIAFVDSDDWIAPEMYNVLHEKMLEYGCQIATCGRFIAKEGKSYNKVFCFEKEKVLTNQEAVNCYLLQNFMNMSACDKLFKRSLFDGISFPDYYTSEDILPIYNALKKAENVLLTGRPFYYYFYRASSITHKAFNDKRNGLYIYAKQVAKDVRINYPSLRDSADFFEYDALLMLWRTIRRSNYKGKQKKELFKTIKSNFWKIIKNSKLTKKHKLYTWLIVFHCDKVIDKIVYGHKY